MTSIEALPSFYHPDHAGWWSYRPDMPLVQAEAEVWRQRFGLTPAADDRHRIELLIIDGQKDFCLPEGALFVAGRSGRGAVEDSRRIAAFIYRNLAHLTRITPTLDSHFSWQIFFDSFWLDADGRRPAPYSTISADDLRAGRYHLDPAVAQFALTDDGRPDYRWAEKQALFYAEALERAGKYSLTIWPCHCLLGSEGHALVGLLQEAREFHSAARKVQSPIEIKGANPWTENYSVFGAEVRGRWDGRGELAHKNESLIRRLVANDAVIVVGQAASHCVLWSVDDLLHEVRAINPALVGKLYLVQDCTSPVVVFGPDGQPLVDFTEATTAAFERWRQEGVQVVSSTTPLAEWPGLEHLG